MSPISGDVKPRARWWSLAALFTFGALMIPMAFAFAGQINPDGIAYLRIARYYLSGDLGRAVSGYWSPLYSWLLVPWLALGVPALLATTLLAAVLALTWVVAVSRLGRAYLKTMVGRRCLVISAAASVLPWSMEVISPDLLLAVLLTFYFAVVLNPEILEKPRRAFDAALGDLYRVLKPGGVLVVTLDNPHSLSMLVGAFKRVLRPDPFFLGRTLSRRQLAASLRRIGYEVHDTTAILHGLENHLSAAMDAAQRVGGARLCRAIGAGLRHLEKLETVPTRYLTGAFVAARTVKPWPARGH